MPTLTPSDAARAARWFHALSDETRLEILRRLSKGERCVCELTDAMDAAQSRLSFHLKTLRTAGLISGRREGRWMYYSINPEVLESSAEFIANLVPTEEWRSGDACCS
jgi:ArsR family transcriptional regulator